jgi:hypothetical protein
MDRKLLTTLAQGCIGGLTFGIYHAYVSQRMIDGNNAKLKKAMEDKLKGEYTITRHPNASQNNYNGDRGFDK